MLKLFARAFAVTSILIVPVQTLSASAAGARLVSGECDSFHLFWNHMSNALDWWRLVALSVEGMHRVRLIPFVVTDYLHVELTKNS